mmetsp:Transcript_5250/g.22270  ORF Transcript_5250/g.22270 Transcript_5250/m.22270 type:complete len:429 (+) Transcript_5250:3734-5020(+)
MNPLRQVSKTFATCGANASPTHPLRRVAGPSASRIACETARRVDIENRRVFVLARILSSVSELFAVSSSSVLASTSPSAAKHAAAPRTADSTSARVLRVSASRADEPEKPSMFGEAVSVLTASLTPPTAASARTSDGRAGRTTEPSESRALFTAERSACVFSCVSLAVAFLAASVNDAPATAPGLFDGTPIVTSEVPFLNVSFPVTVTSLVGFLVSNAANVADASRRRRSSREPQSRTRTSSPSASTSSRSGYISSNTTSVSRDEEVCSMWFSDEMCIFPNRSSYASEYASSPSFSPFLFSVFRTFSAVFICRSYRRRNGSTRSAVGQGSQFGGNTKPLEISRHVKVVLCRDESDVSFVSTRLTSSATKTPRSLILSTFRAASTTWLVGKTSTSLMLSSGTPRTIHGVSAPSLKCGSGTCVATHGPSQ